MNKGTLQDALSNMLFLPLRTIPSWVLTVGAGVFISESMDKRPRFKERLNELDGKVFLFEARDIGKTFYMRIEKNDLRIVPHIAGEPDVIMRGDLKTLISLFLGQEDADTVFFSRKLEINGDTAAAVLLKNLLAGL